MKTLIITATLMASMIASALTVHSAPAKSERFDGAKFFEEVANRSGG